MTTYSIDAQIAEVEREIKMRTDVYGRSVTAGKMRHSVAEYHTNCMRAVLETLREVQKKKGRT